MGAATRICKICGNEYEYCHTEGHKNIFRWQDVACSPEHGSEYFALVLKARGRSTDLTGTQVSNTACDAEMYVEDYDDEPFEEDYDD